MSEHIASPLITETSVPSRAPDTYVVELDGEAVVLDEQANRLHLLNRTATVVWNCLDGEVDVAGLAREISEVLELPFEQVLAETLSVVTDLAVEGLLDGFPAPEGP